MKINLKLLHLRMKKLTLLLLLLFLVHYNPVNAVNTSYEEMRQEFGTNKTFLSDTEIPAIIALSFYPELKFTKIKFEYKEIKTTMAARPEFNCIFNNSRSYVIYINANASENGSVSYQDLNLKQKIGIIAHELAHIVDFESRSNGSIISCGLLYKCSPQYHKNLERSTDELVIKKGLGNELYAFSDYVINHSNASKKYIEFKKKNYLLPEEIKEKMK